MDYKSINIISEQIRIVNPKAIILLEGTRKLPDEKIVLLNEFAYELALKLPDAKFRTGNAKGSDEAFATGIIKLNPKKLEYIVPRKNMRTKYRNQDSACYSADELPEDELNKIVEISIKANPKNKKLILKGIENKKGKSYEIALYLLRDTLKVTGSQYFNLPKSDFAFFYVNEEQPLSGGTGHTINVCNALGVKYFTQNEFLK